jgi:hypothetical protein
MARSLDHGPSRHDPLVSAVVLWHKCRSATLNKRHRPGVMGQGLR